MLNIANSYESRTIKDYIKYLKDNNKKIHPIKIAKKLGYNEEYVLEILESMGIHFTKTIAVIKDGKMLHIRDCDKYYEIVPFDENVNNSNVSIGLLVPSYVEINDIQNKDDEYKKIKKFLNKYVELYSKKRNINPQNVRIEFINYGKTELVYVLTEPNGNRVTLLVKQPSVKFGKVKQEANYLTRLKMCDDNVVAPIEYYQYGDYELYITPYINQARCVASYGSWGMYVPEPEYRFVPFNEEQEKIVITCMISKLVSLYDFDNNEGICECKLGGGDFMLPKGWELELPTIENTLPNLYLIAAREKINCSFEDYLDIIREEFSKATINKNQNDFFINKRARVPMSLEDIEAGIELGKKSIKYKLSSRLVKSLSKK